MQTGPEFMAVVVDFMRESPEELIFRASNVIGSLTALSVFNMTSQLRTLAAGLSHSGGDTPGAAAGDSGMVEPNGARNREHIRK
jgi:hypothetical protein